ncbi:hypothetical protein ACFR9U_17170 [Halorientalis brevis]|uniref:Uncharacterized protein n=1 Tax=Halorientalis brevis TaxID=1126241 RepID=A0ABD6CFI1_9EURY|nr:hypothetical protein [Halorientalis brevis]
MADTGLDDSFDALADEELWMQTAAVGGAYMGSAVAQGALDGMLPVDVPNEAYGVGVAAVGYAYGGSFNRQLATGGALYTLDAFAQRVGVKESINQAAANAGGS